MTEPTEQERAAVGEPSGWPQLGLKAKGKQ